MGNSSNPFMTFSRVQFRKAKYPIQLTFLSAILAVSSAGCSPSMFFGNSKDDDVAKQPTYRTVNPNCSGVNMGGRNGQLSVKGARELIHCFNAYGALDKETHQKALLHRDAALRRNAIRALPASEEGWRLFFSSPVIQDPDLLTRQAAFVKLVEFPTIPEIQTVVAQLPRVKANSEDTYLNDTLTLLGRVHKVADVGQNVVQVEAGDPRRGEDLFFNSPTAACGSCHTVGAKGGAVGPILDGIAVRSDKNAILESLMEPNAKLAQGYENLTISPMPPVGVVLKEQELADIVAFLGTLTTPPKDGITVPVQKPNEFE